MTEQQSKEELVKALAKEQIELAERMKEALETEQIVFYRTKDGKDYVTLPPNPMFIRTSNVIKHGEVDQIWARIDAKKREAEKIRRYVA